jgi:DNA-directed RNA polymerase subunit RPC12/RpoP
MDKPIHEKKLGELTPEDMPAFFGYVQGRIAVADSELSHLIDVTAGTRTGERAEPCRGLCGECGKDFDLGNLTVETSSMAPIVKIRCTHCQTRTFVTLGDDWNTYAEK